jgi:DNA-binding transcriptional MerR regulator
MKVSEDARRVGIAPSAIRFYEASGVLPAPTRAANGYREYGAPDLLRLRIFNSLRGLGLGLAESARLASMCAAGECDAMDGQLLPQIEARRAEVAVRRAELDHLDVQLAGMEEAIRAGRLRDRSDAQKEGGNVRELPVLTCCDCGPGCC